MSIASWNPEAESLVANYEISLELLQRFIDFSQREEWQNLPQLLNDEEIELHSALMKQPQEIWARAVENFDNIDIQQLVRFFTKAEMQLSGWEAGANSPVIYLVKILRQRKAAPSKELLLWIKSHSSNRFLPNGAL